MNSTSEDEILTETLRGARNLKAISRDIHDTLGEDKKTIQDISDQQTIDEATLKAANDLLKSDSHLIWRNWWIDVFLLLFPIVVATFVTLLISKSITVAVAFLWLILGVVIFLTFQNFFR